MIGDTDEGQVRRLVPDDAAAVAGLVRQLGYSAQEDELRKRIQEWSDDERGAAFGVTAPDGLVAFAAVYVVPFFERPGSRARLVAIAVDERHRHRGLGRVLVGRAREFARVHGALEIEVTSRRERYEADRFYTALGFSNVTGRSRRYVAEI